MGDEQPARHDRQDYIGKKTGSGGCHSVGSWKAPRAQRKPRSGAERPGLNFSRVLASTWLGRSSLPPPRVTRREASASEPFGFVTGAEPEAQLGEEDVVVHEMTQGQGQQARAGHEDQPGKASSTFGAARTHFGRARLGGFWLAAHALFTALYLVRLLLAVERARSVKNCSAK
jgi:hypothetical protein